MQERIDAEFALLRKRFPQCEYHRAGEHHWFRVPAYPLPAGWNRSETDVACLVPPAYPGTQPYGIYIPAGLLYNNTRPSNYTEPAGSAPPFPGSWGMFSWQPDSGQWKPKDDPAAGSNLLNWFLGFAERFKQGQ